MKSSLPDSSLIRQYLLGRLDENIELESDLSERILFSDDLSDIVDSIEEEIIEDYLDGVLNSVDKNAVDKYFLRPPERREKLRFAKLLRHELHNTNPDAFVRPPIVWSSYFKTYGQVAALILLSVLGLLYVSGVRKRQARLEGELSQERQRSASVERKEQLSSSLMALTLVSDRSRAAGAQIPHLEVTPSTERIIVDIALQGSPSGSYDVVLETKDGKGPIWSARLLPIMSPSGDARLVFDIPLRGIESDIYSFVVSPTLAGPGRGKHYDWHIKVTR
jgi:hypothetical protein